MRAFWRRNLRRSAFELDLATYRPQPRAEFVRALSRRVSSASGRPSHAGSRAAFAAGFTVFMVGTFASFGGLGYAATSAADTVELVKRIVVSDSGPRVPTASSAADQYEPETAPAVGVFTPPTAPPPAPEGAVAADVLPFTGISLAVTGALGSLLLGLGLALRRYEKRRTAS